MKITTIDQARALPEITSSIFEDVVDILPDGTTKISCKIRPLCGGGFESDEIWMFEDIDGRCMQVTYTENGPAKVEVGM